MSDKIKLLPCPFCGGENIFRAAGDLGGYHIFCDDCFAESGTGETEEEAAEIWNHRIAAPAAPVAQEPVAGVVLRDGQPTLVMEKFIKRTDQRVYTAPPAAEQPDAVAVPRELLREAARRLEVHDAGGGSLEGATAADLRALLAGGAE